MRPPAAPTTMRITPTVLMSTPDTSAETAHVRIAPIAIRRRLTPIPIIHPFLLTGSGPSRRAGPFEVARMEYPEPVRGKRAAGRSTTPPPFEASSAVGIPEP